MHSKINTHYLFGIRNTAMRWLLVTVSSLFLSGLCMALPGDRIPGHSARTANLSPLWEGATVFDGGWIHSDWYGYLFPQQQWILHLEHNWQYCLGSDPENLFVYDFGVGAWAYTGASLYPWMFWYGNLGNWTYYYRNGRPGNRWFYLPATSEYRNDNSLNGAVFIEGTPRNLAVSSSSTPGHVPDPETGYVFVTPPNQAGSIEVASLERAPSPPFPGTGLAIAVSGLDELSLSIPKSQLTGEAVPLAYVYGTVQGAFDDPTGNRERWIGLPYVTSGDGSYVFELPIAEPAPPGIRSTGSWPQLANPTGPQPRHYFVSKITPDMPEYAQRNNVELQVAAYVLDFTASLNPTRATTVTSRSNEANLSFSYGGNYYTGFNKMRAWSYGRSFLPVISIESPLRTSALAHETGHYLTHLLVGHDTYDALEKAGGSLLGSTHGIREQIGRSNLLEDYAYVIEYFLSSYGGSSDLQQPHVTFGGMSALTTDFPGLEGFAATMLTCLNLSGTSMRNYLGRSVPIAPLSLSYLDIFEIMSKGAQTVDALRSNIETSLSTDKRKALQVLLQRIGWGYYVRGTLVDDKGDPVVGASVRSITKIGDTIYEGESSNIPSKADGGFVLTGGVFGGNSLIEVTLGANQVINVPVTIDWATPTDEVIELGTLLVAGTELSDVSFNTDYGYDGWPPNFTLNLAAELDIEIQGLDNETFRVETTEDFQAHEPWINVVIYATTGSRLTMKGAASITPSAASGSYENSFGEIVNWTFEDQFVYATSPEFGEPVGTSAQLDYSLIVESGVNGQAVFMLNGSIMKGDVRSSGVQGRINITVVGE